MIHARTRARREVLAAKVLAFLDARCCTDCGETDPLVLEFDHIGDDKAADVSRLVVDGVSWERVAQEIAKCEVVCANCHRRRTAQRAATVRWRFLASVGRPGLEPGTTTA